MNSAWVGAKVLKQWLLIQCFHCTILDYAVHYYTMLYYTQVYGDRTAFVHMLMSSGWTSNLLIEDVPRKERGALIQGFGAKRQDTFRDLLNPKPYRMSAVNFVSRCRLVDAVKFFSF